MSLIHSVAPLVGAWIEICNYLFYPYQMMVAPLVGAWIEIIRAKAGWLEKIVAPLVGAWIEIPYFCTMAERSDSRSPRGSVD